MKQSILVTGSSSGIGRSISETLARNGHTVFATMRNVTGKNATTAQELQTLAKDENLDLHVLELDVTSDESVASAVETALKIAGAIDVVVNNAGVMTVGVSESYSVAQLQQMYDINVLGVFRMAKAVLPSMRKRGAGYLVYVSSTSSHVVFPYMGLYGSTKAAESAIAETIHYETYTLGIDTTILQCGGYATSLPNNLLDGVETNIVGEYGMSWTIGMGLRGGFSSALAAAGNPKDLAATIAELIEKPAGQRPLFLPIGPTSEPIGPINDAHVALQEQVLAGLRMSSLTKR